jgi:hypothetical protein
MSLHNNPTRSKTSKMRTYLFNTLTGTRKKRSPNKIGELNRTHNPVHTAPQVQKDYDKIHRFVKTYFHDRNITDKSYHNRKHHLRMTSYRRNPHNYNGYVDDVEYQLSLYKQKHNLNNKTDVDVLNNIKNDMTIQTRLTRDATLLATKLKEAKEEYENKLKTSRSASERKQERVFNKPRTAHAFKQRTPHGVFTKPRTYKSSPDYTISQSACKRRTKKTKWRQ